MNIYDLISRAQKLRKETQLDSVSPDRVGGLHEDTLKYINEFQLLASSPSLHKAYASVSAMQSDKSPKSDLTGKPLKPGQLVVIVPANQTDATAGDVYRYDGPSGNTSAWTFVAKIGAVPADAELSATSTNPPQNKVVTEKLTELESEVGTIYSYGQYDINTSLERLLDYKGQKLNFIIAPVVGAQGGVNFYNGDTYITTYADSGEMIIPTSATKVEVRYGAIYLEVTKPSLQPSAIREDLEKAKSDLSVKSEVFSSRIFGKEDYISGRYKTSGSVLEEVANSSVNQIIDSEVKEGDIFVIKGFGAFSYRLWAFVDAENNIISQAEDSAEAKMPISITAPENAVMAIFSSYNNELGAGFCVSKNGIYDKALENVKKSQDVSSTIEVPLSNPYIYPTNGDVLGEPVYNTSVYQRVDSDAKEGDVYRIKAYGTSTYRLWAFVDAENNIISKASDSLDWSGYAREVVAPKGTVAAYFGYYGGQPNEPITRTRLSKLELLTKRVDALESQPNVSPLINKKVYFCGDSIMAGSNFPKEEQLPGVIARLTGCTYTKLAIDGSLFYDETWYVGSSRSILWQVKQIPTDADYIIIQGGVNGVNMTDSSVQNYAPMGEMTNSYESDFDAKSQIGCLEAMFRYLYDTFPNAKIGFIMTYQIGGDYSSYLGYWKKKIDAFLPVLEKWGIPVFDWRNTGINLAANAKTYGIDAWSKYEEFDSTKSYDTDDKVLYQGAAYKANEPISAGAWDSSKWTKVTSDRYDTWHANALAYQILGEKTASWMATL